MRGDRGSKVECLVKIPYERLEACAVAKGSVFVEAASGGKARKAAGSGDLKLYRQFCYVRRSAPGEVEHVPSPPTREETAAQSERESQERRRKTQEAEQRIREEGQQMQRESQERQRALEQQAQEAQEKIREASQGP
jgi:septin family protein